MADNNDKLSLHIGSKNVTTLTSGFVDVPAIPTISTKLTLNRQTVVSLNGGDGGPAGIGITQTGGQVGGKATKATTNSGIEQSTYHLVSCYSACLICCNHYP